MSAAAVGDIWGIFRAASYKVSGQQQDDTPLSHCFQYLTVPSDWCCQIILPWVAGAASPFPIPALTQSLGAPSPGTPQGHSGSTAFQSFLGASLRDFGLAFPRILLCCAVALAGVTLLTAGACRG